MSALPVNFNPYDPIPNGPFYSTLSYYLQGPTGPLIIGSGLSVSLGGVISSTGGGGGGGTVTSITAGSGLTGGTITSTGTIALANSGVIAGSYSFAAISVDAFGRVTSASSGSPVTSVSVNSPLLISGSVSAPTIGIQLATTSQYGATLLNNTTSSTLTNQALTAAAGKNLQDQINALSQNANGLILAGTLNVTTGLVVSVTTAGNLAGFTAGAVVPAATPAINDYYLIVTTASPSGTTYTPTGGPTFTGVIVGDYILVASGVWSILRVGPVAAAYATTTTPGLVELATVAEAQAGVNPNVVLTPNTGSQTYLARSCFTTSGQVLAGTGSTTYAAVPVGTDGYVLTADSSCSTGVKWAAGGGGGGGITALSGAAPVFTTPALVTSGAGAIGINAASTSACGAVQLATTADVLSGLSTTLAVTPAAGAAGYVSAATFNLAGDLVVGTGNDTYTRLAVGANGLTLVTCSACAEGVTWAPVPTALPLTAGTVYGLGEPGVALNFAVGKQALQVIGGGGQTGQGNTAVGIGAGAVINSGCGNILVGGGAGSALTSACYNVAVGSCALGTETAGLFNTALGTGALQLQNGGSQNTAVGYGTGNSITTGLANTLVGAVAGDALTSGGCNVLVGVNAGLALTTTNNNVMVGTNSGCNSTGSANVFVGCGAALNATTQNNQIVLGAGNSCTLGTANGGVTFAFGASCFLYASAGSAVWTSASDVRLKEEVADLALGLDFVNQIQPRTYQWKENKEKADGFVAQELQEVVAEHDASYLGLVDTDNEYMGVAPGALIPVLVKAIQELSAEVAELKAKLS